MSGSSKFSVAVHACVALADLLEKGHEHASSALLARSVNTNPAYLRRILSNLVSADVLTSLAGKDGGLRLARPADKITLEQIYRAVADSPILSVHRQKVNKACDVSCRIKDLMGEVAASVDDAVGNRLRKTTVAGLLAQI